MWRLKGRLESLGNPMPYVCHRQKCGPSATLTGVAISRLGAGRLVDLRVLAELLGLLTQLGVLTPLGMARTVVMAQVQWAGALPADECSPSPAHTPRVRGPEQQKRRLCPES
jgi:hypothetical protein